MTFITRTFAAVAMAALLAGGAAVVEPVQAQTQKKAMTAEEKRAKSKECSTLADQRGLKGKKRRAFRSECKRGRV
jgi:hypothetical protein